jgi:hypothetical protein
MADKKQLTGADTHRATERGYAIPDGTNAGQLIEDGDMIPANVPVGSWMEPVKGKDRALAGAVAEALDESPKDVDLTQVGVPGLKAMAAERGINPKGLSEADLITAIKAEREKTI